MGPTPTSERADSARLPDMLHPLHVYWSMPRRFRLLFESRACHCDVCGRDSDTSICEVKAKNYGINYEGPWRHPLTPYRFDPKKLGTPPWTQKGRPGGIDYRHWGAFVFVDRERLGALPAIVIDDYAHGKNRICREEFEEGALDASLARNARLWVFGFDLENMKARGWTSSEMPLVTVRPERLDVFREWVSAFVDLAIAVSRELSDRVKQAWFKRPKDVGGDMSYVAGAFFEATQPAFFDALRELRDALDTEAEANHLPTQVAENWYRALRRQALALFDEHALSGPLEERALGRIMRQRRWLRIWLFGGGTKKARKSNPVALFAELGGFETSERAQAPTEEVIDG